MSGLDPDWGNAAKFSRAQTSLKTRQSNMVKLNCVMSAIRVSSCLQLDLKKPELQTCLQFGFLMFAIRFKETRIANMSAIRVSHVCNLNL